VKLIRDRIGIDVNDGPKYRDRIIMRVPEDQIPTLALQKLVEEAAECLTAETKDHLTEELGDLFEVIDLVIASHKLKVMDVIAIQEKKRKERGGFALGRVVL
jgi:predicted house-cleaning noncanonical NTP pyrophosphatase (MazG superfamily)